MIHDDATRMELDSAIAYLVGHVVVAFGAEFDMIVLHLVLRYHLADFGESPALWSHMLH